MVGRDPSTFYQRESVPIGEVVFEARNVSGNGVRNVSFELRRGEVLGIAGMTGSGRSELMKVLFGSARLDSGEIRIDGRRVRHASPKAAIRNRMCFITEDRQNTGLFLQQTIAQNVIVANLVNTRNFFARPSEDIRTGDRFVKKLLIKAKDAKVRVMNLSGGNQQKVVLAKWFNTDGEIFIFDEPTRGIDVGSKQEIYQVMVELLKEGKAIIMVSSDMPEVISMSDRVIVMKDGEMVGRARQGRDHRREHPHLLHRGQGRMNDRTSPENKKTSKVSLFKRHENLTVTVDLCRPSSSSSWSSSSSSAAGPATRPSSARSTC